MNRRDALRALLASLAVSSGGADPGNLPVELPTLIELIVNRKTANALGVKIPQLVLLRADRVIE